jgi:hypothetical protein
LAAWPLFIRLAKRLPILSVQILSAQPPACDKLLSTPPQLCIPREHQIGSYPERVFHSGNSLSLLLRYGVISMLLSPMTGYRLMENCTPTSTGNSQQMTPPLRGDLYDRQLDHLLARTGRYLMTQPA